MLRRYPTISSRDHGQKASAILGAMISLLFFFFVATPLAAQQDSAEARRACTPDVFRLCSEFVPDAERITACLRQQRKYLSVACRRVMAGPPAAK